MRYAGLLALALCLHGCVGGAGVPQGAGQVPVAEAMADILGLVQPHSPPDSVRLAAQPQSGGEDAHKLRTHRDLANTDISMEIEQVPTRLLFRALAALNDLEVVPDQHLQAELSMHLQRLPWLRAVRLLAASLGWQAHFSASAGLVRIMDSDCTSPDCHRRQLRVLEHRNAVTLATSLQQNLQQSSGGALLITADAVSNGLLLAGPEDALQRTLHLIDELDRPRPVVLIQAWVLEISGDSQRRLGVDLGLSRGDVQGGLPDAAGGGYDNLLRNSPAAASGALIARAASSGLALRLAALARQGYTRILSNPRIYVVEGEQAEIFQGDEVPYTVRTQEGGSHTEFRQAGLGLKVLPRLQASGRLSLQLEITKDTVDRSRDNPPISRREIRTRLIIAPGEAALIGGISSTGETRVRKGVPGLGAVGGLGESGRDDAQLMVILSAAVLGERRGTEAEAQADKAGKHTGGQR